MDDLREVIARAMRENMKVDASGLSPGVAHMYVQPEPDGFLCDLKQAGLVVVPAEPTEAMTTAGFETLLCNSKPSWADAAADAYRAMIEASNAPT